MQRSSGAAFRNMHAARAAGPVILPSQALAEMLAEEDAEHIARERAAREALTPFLDWALRIPEPKTGTLNFERWPFQKDLYEAGVGVHEGVIMKGTQVGCSTWLLRWTMYWPDMKGLTALYVFPKKTQLRDFSQGRVRPLIKRDGSYLSTRVPQDNIDNAMMKQIGMGLVYFRGSEVKDDLDSVDADVIAFDEYDRLDQHNIEDAEHRVDASPLGLIRRIGNPTIDEFGIAKAYAASDKRQWFVKCECGLHQPLDFWKNVDVERVAVVCSNEDCRKILDVRRGEWVAEYPDRDVIGWQVNRLMVHGVNLAKIITNSEKGDPYAQQTFWNKDLGLPYSSNEARLTEAHIRACQSRGGGYRMPFEYTGESLVTMGIDVASKRALNVRVSEWVRDASETTKPVKRALWIGKVTRWSANDDGEGPSLDELMQRYQPHMAGIDHEPEYNSAMGFVNRWPGRVVVINYSGTQKDLITVDLEMRRAGVRRTEQIDKCFDMVRSQRNYLPDDIPTDYIASMRSLVRIVEENDKGQRIARYVKTAAPDDDAHADVYDNVAADFFWIEQATVAATQQTQQPLDEMMEFQRSDLDDPDSDAYREGPEADLSQYQADYDPMGGWD